MKPLEAVLSADGVTGLSAEREYFSHTTQKIEKIVTMSFFEDLKETSTSLLNQLGLAWWLQIVTEEPLCTYYFGPFISAKEAEKAQSGYIEDLEHEETQGITVNIKRCQPKELTIFEDELFDFDSRISPTISHFAQVYSR